MTITSDASLRGKSKALAKKHGLSAQEVMQMYLFERFLVRLEKSSYRDKFILKGGLLISSLIGVSNRTTMDMDATLRSVALDEDTVARVISGICAIETDDGIEFCYERSEPIRKDADYGGLRAHLRARFGRTNVPMKIDLTTGDAITPASVEYPFPMMFEEGSVSVMSYPLSTSIAEKFEAVVKRGVTTTRARDLYDIAALTRAYGSRMEWSEVGLAIESTARSRGSLQLMAGYELVCDEMLASKVVHRMWENYTERNSYAALVTLEEAVEAVRGVGKKALIAPDHLA